MAKQHRTKAQQERGNSPHPNSGRQAMQLWMTRMGAYKLALAMGARGYESRFGQQSLFLLEKLTALCSHTVRPAFCTRIITYMLSLPRRDKPSFCTRIST